MTVCLPWSALLGVMLLAGCGGGPSEEDNQAAENAAAAIKPGPMLGGVDLSKPLRLQGAESPKWTMDLAPGRIMYRPAGKPEIPFYPVSPRISGGQAVYPTQTPDGDKVEITLRAMPCGTGDTAAPLTATLAIGAQRLAACAKPLPIEQIRYDLYNEAMSDADNAGG